MLRRILRSFPHSSQSSRQYSPIVRQRRALVAAAAAAPLGPSLLLFLGVSATTVATFIITIHGDAAQPPPNQPEKPDLSIRKSRDTPFDYLIPHPISPSPTANETFDSCSDAGIPQEKTTGVSRIDGILLPRYIIQHTIPTFIFFFKDRSHFQPIATPQAKTPSITSPSSSLADSATLCLEFTMDITERR